jgi:hypothetical protein
MPSDVREITTRLAQTATFTVPTCPRITLVVLERPDADRQFILSDAASQRVHIGSSGLCELALQIPRYRGATLLRDASGLRLSDLESVSVKVVVG